MGEITHGQVRANLDARLASGEFRIVGRSQGVPGRQFTSAKTIEAEHEILRQMRAGQNHIEPVLSRPQAIAVADQHPHLNHAQRTVVEDVLSSPDRIQGIQGYAGAGKTTTLAAIRSAAESQGYQIEGFAPTSRAARQLNEAGFHAATLQGFLARGSTPTAPEQKRFYFVDESSLASTNQMRDFLERIGPNNNDRVLLIGDIRQHQSVEAGRPFEQLQDAGMYTAKLNEIVRQKDPALKSAVEMLATGRASAALNALQHQGRVKEIPNAEERVRAIAVYREIELEFSVGDRIQFTAPNKSLGVANRDLAVISSIAPDGRVTARLDNNHQIEFNASEHRHFDHGYAVRSHSSQGLTAERVLVHADTNIHPDSLNSRFAYVSISRASHEATLFNDDMTKLGLQLRADVSKTSINRNVSMVQGIGIGI
jgi:ATP-dependent exoDNAse (exonuclease V) alpha subunit